MNQTDKLLLGLCILLPLIVIVNAALWGVYQNRHKRGLPAPVNKIHEVLKRPWKNEEDGLAELSQRVAELRIPDQPQPDTAPPDQHDP